MKTKMLLLITVSALLLGGCSDTEQPGQSNTGKNTSRQGGGTTEGAKSGPTEAPDLVSVGGFREGPTTDQGEPTTLVDFEFDQKAYLTGSNRTSFHLAPTDGGDALDAADIVPSSDKEGDRVITTTFIGKLSPKDFARGFVDKEVLSSDKAGNGPTNVGHSEDIAEKTSTSNPDLKAVTKDADQVLFEFDQPLTQDDVVQNTGGLRIYFPNTRQAGAIAVQRTGDQSVLRATYKDLPGDFSLKDATGGFVTQGTVQGTSKNATNAFDEVSPLDDTGAVACPAPDIAGKPGEGNGPTEAPDLTSVGNFRRGPVTDQGEPRTCVDFVFDQKAYLKGGNRTSFHLARADGSDALDAADVIPKSGKEGDAVVTAAFPGKLKPENFPRGYVDSKVVTSRKQGANRDKPYNVNQAAPVSDGKTKNPDLISVTRDGDQMLYELDEPLTRDDVVQNTGGLRIYFPTTDQSAIRQAGALSVKRKDATTLRAFFGDDLPGNRKLTDAVGAFVKQGSVQAAKGSRGGNDGKSAFDEVSHLKDTGSEVCPAPDAVGRSGAGGGPTEAPDLTHVGNFRRGPFTSQFTPTTCVDFEFDQKAYLTGSNRTSFHLAPTDGGDALDATDIVPSSDKEGDVVVTATFPGELKPEDFARGYVNRKTLSSDKAGNAPTNVGQAADIGDSNSTVDPDLVSITRDKNQFLFEFDQPLTQEDVVQDTGGLRVYFPDTQQTQATAVDKTNDPKVLRATFKQLPQGLNLSNVTGGFVTQGAVQGKSKGATNAFDELSQIKKP